MKKIYLLFFSVLFIISCSNSNKKKIVSSPDAKIVMAESMQRFSNAWNLGNAKMLAEEFTNDAVRVISNPLSPIKGEDAILKSFESTFSEGSELYKSRIETSVLETRKISNDIFLGAGMFKILDQNDNVLEEGKWGNVFKYSNGKIKFLLESAHRTPKAQSEIKNLTVLDSSITSEELHFDKIQESILNYMKNFNTGNAEGLSLLFTDNGIQSVSSKNSILLGREKIRDSEIFSEGQTLSANIMGYKYLENSIAIAYGKWFQIDEIKGTTMSGQWGNLFKIEGDKAMLIMESAGVTQ